ncbi:5'-methylthioadenosine phosphorylase [Desulfitispora alkaliphila]|uniref:S-methyl-5'-thioadenosine phosphorylase n=1 Tax=Desulfitispora alkaliphila TaxID=622674 RepID=UPI003D197082
MEATVGIIGGTGVYDASVLEDVKQEPILTDYGEVVIQFGTYQGKRVAFLARHGVGHTLPPHLINYRANIQALKQVGVQKIIATAAVGSLNEELRPGQFILIDQFIDFTKSRASTFYEGGEQGVVHVDMTTPYCTALTAELKGVASKAKVDIGVGGTYVCTEGPRFETPAEIKMYAQLGGNLVGMTSVPEVVLAREAQMCYATVAMVTNYAAGISQSPLTHKEVVETMDSNREKFKKFIMEAISSITEERPCSCSKAIDELGKF